MAVTFINKTEFSGQVPCFQVQPTEREVMGYALADKTLPVGTLIPMGTPVSVDEDTKKATICKYAVVEKKVDTKNFFLKSIGFFAVGDYICVSGGTAYSKISAIDADTRKITLSTANTEIDAKSVILEAVQVAGGTADAPTQTTKAKNVPNRIVAHADKVRATDNTISVTFKAVAISNVLNYPDEYLNKETFPGSTLLAGNPLIFFVKQ